MRRTITTPNHFITCIQSWRGKIAGISIVLFVLLFLSCKDDASSIGFPKDPRLNATYIEIPLDPSVIQYNKVLSLNVVGETPSRFLVGKYDDPVFGSIEARGYASIAPPVAAFSPSTSATVDSLVLQLNVDYYYYGTADISKQHLQVFELLDTLTPVRPYYSTTQVGVSGKLLADTSFYVNPTEFDNAIVANSDTDTSNDQHMRIRMRMPQDLGDRFLTDLKDTTKALINSYKSFTGTYKGFAFVVDQGDKIIGINPATSTVPTSRETKISLYFTDNGIQSRADYTLYYSYGVYNGLLNQAESYTQVKANRAGTALSGIQPYTEFRPPDGRFYVQGGTSLMTKFDLTKFYAVADTLNHVVINSAQLVFANSLQRNVPYYLELKVLDQFNKFRYPYTDTVINNNKTISPAAIDSTIIDSYLSKLGNSIGVVTNSFVPSVTIYNSLSAKIAITVDTHEADEVYITEFVQQLVNHKDHPRRITAFALAPQDFELRKSVNGIVMESAPVLRLYYSKPVSKIR